MTLLIATFSFSITLSLTHPASLGTTKLAKASITNTMLMRKSLYASPGFRYTLIISCAALLSLAGSSRALLPLLFNERNHLSLHQSHRRLCMHLEPQPRLAPLTQGMPWRILHRRIAWCVE